MPIRSCSSHALLLMAIAGGAFASSPAAAQASRSNMARYQFATGDSFVDEHRAEYLTDGKFGPRNRWESGTRGQHECAIFFDEPVTIGSVAVFSGMQGDDPIEGFTVQYINAQGQTVNVPGGSISSNTSRAAQVVVDMPVTTTRLVFLLGNRTVQIDEIAAYPPGVDAPLGADLTPHLGRAHRVALTPASSRASGTRRRAIVDGFVSDTEVWKSANSAGPHWIELDLRDPDETDPPRVRTQTEPVTIGSVHVYSGTAGGSPVVSAGHMEMFENGAWIDIPGASFAGNTSDFTDIVFAAPVTTDRIRFVAEGGTQATIQEIVPLPYLDGMSWPEGTGVTFGPRPDYRTLSDDFYVISPASDGGVLTPGGDGSSTVQPDAGVLGQHYQVLLNVSTDTYRVRNRITGMCLEVEGASLDAGAAVSEAPYSAMPHQVWRMQDIGGETQFINALSGLALSVATDDTLDQQEPRTDRPQQRWTLAQRDVFPKKGQGGFPQLADVFESSWAYNWGKDDTYPSNVDYWPMQWGSFFWERWPSRTPGWQRNPEPHMLMGYNEPDGAEQADIPVQVGIDMWPRLEAQDLPLLAPAPVGPTNSWITDFMNGVDEREMRVEYVAVHRYPGPNADGFISSLASARNAFNRDIIVSEFSVVDWSDTNSWTTDDCFNFFAEVFWRMEDLPWVRRYAIFIFTDDPQNPISDNRGEILNADGSLTPSGKLFAAWDGDTTIRTDTPYHLHNEGTFKRVGVLNGDAGTGDRFDDTEAYQWSLVPSETAGEYLVRSVSNGDVFSYSSRGPALIRASAAGSGSAFRVVEAEHGWFYVEDAVGGRRLESDGSVGGALKFAAPGTTGDDVRWRFLPVLNGPPLAPRDITSEAIGGPEVLVSWADHGFRDLLGFNVYRTGPGMTDRTLIAENVITTEFVDSAPLAGSYSYEVTAVGDTGESLPAAAGAVSLITCEADFNGDFIVNAADAVALVNAVVAGIDYDGSGAADALDVIAYLATQPSDCPSD